MAWNCGSRFGRLAGTVLLLLVMVSVLTFGLGGPTIVSDQAGSTITLPSAGVNTAGSATTFTISGTELSLDGELLVTAPAEVEVSSDGAAWGTSFPVAYVGSTLGATTVYVRLATSATPGIYSGNVVISGGGASDENQAVSGSVTYVPEFASASISILEAEPYLENVPLTLRIENIVDQYGDLYDPQGIEYSFDGISFFSLTITPGAFSYDIQYTYMNYGTKTITVTFDVGNLGTINLLVAYIPAYASATFQVTPDSSFVQYRPIVASISDLRDQKNLSYIPTSSEVRFETTGGALVYEESLGGCLGGCSATTSFDTAGDYVVRFYVDGIERDSLGFSILADATAPTVTIDRAAGQADPTGTWPITFKVVFDEAVTGFETGDVTLSGSAGATVGTIAEMAPMDGTAYSVEVSGMTGDGGVIAVISAGVATDLAGNPNVISTSTDNSVTYDTTAPSVQALNVDTPQMNESDLTQQVAVTFDEEMDASVPPTFTFSQGTFTSHNDGSWSAGDTVWTETFALADNNGQLPGIDIQVAGARDIVGHIMAPYVKSSAFAVDTGLAPVEEESHSLVVSILASDDSEPTSIWPIPDDEDVVWAGLRPLSAVVDSSHTTIVFWAQILDAQDEPVRHSWVHVYVYAVDLSKAMESFALIEHWVVHCDPISLNHLIEIELSDLPLGFYDIHLAFANGKAQTLRIQLAEAEE